jgi:energy-coupling factor transporter ATP-binding protein EcfA2
LEVCGYLTWVLIFKWETWVVRSNTLIIITHRLRTITIADQILVVDGGRVVEQGRHNELVDAGGLYYRFWDKRQKARGWMVGHHSVINVDDGKDHTEYVKKYGIRLYTGIELGILEQR